VSYVIQNFNQPNKHLVLTPKFKLLVLLKSMKQVFFFFKINSFLYNVRRFNTTLLNYSILFYKYFYFSQLFKMVQRSNLNLSGSYSNNLKKSITYFILYLFNLYLDSKTTVVSPITHEKNLISNLYFYSIKVVNFQLNNKFYKNFLFFNLLA
jgi:hypothetical protein